MSHGKLHILLSVVCIVIFSISFNCYIIYRILEPGALIQPRNICCMDMLCHVYYLLSRIQRNLTLPLFLKQRSFNQSPH